MLRYSEGRSSINATPTTNADENPAILAARVKTVRHRHVHEHKHQTKTVAFTQYLDDSPPSHHDNLNLSLQLNAAMFAIVSSMQ